MTLGRFIKKRRLELNISQREITDLFGWGSPQYLSNIERGISNLPIACAKKVAKKLKVSPKTFREFYLNDYTKKLDRYL